MQSYQIRFGIFQKGICSFMHGLNFYAYLLGLHTVYKKCV